jgi:ABC-2 type transport system permease protein
MFALIQKELRAYWNSPIAYIFIGVFLVTSFWFFFRTFFLMGQADMRGFFDLLPWIFLFLIPALTMRIWSEEYKQGTIELLMTSSLSMRSIVLGKFFAVVLFFLLAMAATLSLPLSVSLVGNLDIGATMAGYIGSLLLGISYIAIGVFISSCTKNQIVAFIMSVVVCFIFFIIGQPIVIFALPGFIAPIFEFISLGAHYDSIVRGVVDTRDVIYYLSIIGLFLYLNKLSLLARR